MTRENVRLSILIHRNPVAILLKSEDFVGILPASSPLWVLGARYFQHDFMLTCAQFMRCDVTQFHTCKGPATSRTQEIRLHRVWFSTARLLVLVQRRYSYIATGLCVFKQAETAPNCLQRVSFVSPQKKLLFPYRNQFCVYI